MVAFHISHFYQPSKKVIKQIVALANDNGAKLDATDKGTVFEFESHEEANRFYNQLPSEAKQFTDIEVE